MKLPSVKELQVAGKKVLLRTNYDVPLRLAGARSGLQPELSAERQTPEIADETRIEESLPTIKYLLKQKAKIIIVSHLGRPGGKVVPELSLKPVAEKLEEFLNSKFKIQNSKLQLKTKNFCTFELNRDLILLENLRFHPEEEKNDLEFAKELASLADFYVNEAFACSHRNHASIVGAPRLFPATRRAFGFDFLKEVEVLSKVRENPFHPVVLILGGVKKDKIKYAKKLISWADWVLIGGKIVEYDEVPVLLGHHKIVGSLLKNGEDITMETAKEFEKIILKAKTVVWSGPMGDIYNDYTQGTKKIAQSVVKSRAFTVVGGGDTGAALTKFGLEKKINFISSGGGAMLDFLVEGSLPGIEAIL